MVTTKPDDTGRETADQAGAGGPARPSRRGLLAGAGLFGAGAVAGGLTGYFTHSGGQAAAGGGDTELGQQTVPFYGAHQPASSPRLRTGWRSAP